MCVSTAFAQLGTRQTADPLSVGVRQLREGATFAAVGALREALKQGDPRAHVVLASAYFVLNQRALFAKEVAAAKSAFPSDPEPYYIEGRYLSEVEDRQEAAIVQFEQALARNPQHVKARCHLGIAFRSMQRASDAEEHLLKAIQLIEARKLSFYLPYQTLSSQYLEFGRIDEAERYIKAAVAMAPEVPLNQFLLGKITEAQGRSAEAITALRTTIRLDEAFLEARYLLAAILRKQGDATGSRQQLAEFTRLKDIYGAGRLR